MFKRAEDSLERKNTDWRQNRTKVRKGQVWRKNDNGNVGMVTAVMPDWVYMRQPCRKKCHHVSKGDLLRFWTKL